MTCRLVFDGGGTRTRGALYCDGQRIAETEGPASNPIACGVYRGARVIGDLARALAESSPEPPAVLAAGISGFGKVSDPAPYLDRLFACGVERLRLSNDLVPLASANLQDGAGILVIAGTGSSIAVQKSDGALEIFGGRGPRFGEAGSGYAIATRALRAAGDALDGAGPPTTLVQALQEEAAAESPEAWVRWAAAASKAEIATLVPRILAEASRGDTAAQAIVNAEAEALAALVAGAARRCAVAPDAVIMLAGGLLLDAEDYREAVMQAFAKHLPEARVAPAPCSGVEAVLRMAQTESLPTGVREYTCGDASSERPTERRPAHAPLDALPPEDIARTMTASDRRAVEAVDESRPAIARAIEMAANALAAGGRLIYIGAGTSGRLAVLDAAECPPTFGSDPDDVVALIAGGDAALRHAVEGAEDDRARARADLEALQPALSPHDVLVGVAASGTTPYVLAALEHARENKAATILLCCNPIASASVDLVIDLDTGPEALPGSTRLKAGTATKLALNQISTGAMTRVGRVFEGYMVGVRPSNAKLRARCVRILAAITGLEAAAAEALLDRCGGDIRAGVLVHRKGLDPETAAAKLRAARGNLREVLE